jgi:hypothetical protein
MFKGARSSAVVALLVLVSGLAIAACGSSSSGSSASASSAGASTATTSTGTTTTGTTTTGTTTTGGRGFASLTATQRSCLKSKGVTLPSGGGFRGGAGTGTFTRPAGGFGGTPPGGTSTTGTGRGGGPGGGGFGGGFAGGANGSKDAAAFTACGVSFGGRFRGGFAAGGGAGAKVSTTAIKAFVSCVDQHGYKVTDVNTSGKGAVLPASLQTNKKFLAAARSCTSLLRPTAGVGGRTTTSSG